MNNLERLIGERLYLGIRAIFYFKFMFALAIFFGRREVVVEGNIEMTTYYFGNAAYVVALTTIDDEDIGESFEQVMSKIMENMEDDDD